MHLPMTFMGLVPVVSVPTTPAGRVLAELLGDVGPLLLAVPLLIVAAEYGRLRPMEGNASGRWRVPCTRCAAFDHAADACYCKMCGACLAAVPIMFSSARSGTEGP